jgi:ribose transport system ATP-binding protein
MFEELATTGEVAVEVRNLRVRPTATPLDLTVERGEILGVAGLEGHGQDAFLKALCGLEKPVSGEVWVRTRAGGQQRVRSFRQAAGVGVAYLARDRKSEGIFPPLSVLDNFSLVTLPSLSRLGFPNQRAIRRSYDEMQARLSIVAPSSSAPITALSGGNQQKVLLARWLAFAPTVMVLNDPTRGVDLVTRRALYEVFRQTTEEGMALVVLSTEIEELLELCPRVLVFREGAVFAELAQPGMTMSSIIAAMFGGRSD